MLNTHRLSGRARAKAVADYGFLGWAVLKELLDSDYCDRLVRQAETLQFDTIFNAQTKGKSLESKKSTRAVTKGGPEADAALRSIYCLLKEMLIISDTHLWALGRGASFLKTPPGCLEQVSVTHTWQLFPNPGAGTTSGLLRIQDG